MAAYPCTPAVHVGSGMGSTGLAKDLTYGTINLQKFQILVFQTYCEVHSSFFLREEGYFFTTNVHACLLTLHNISAMFDGMQFDRIMILDMLIF